MPWYEHCIPGLVSTLPKENWAALSKRGVLFFPTAALCSPPASPGALTEGRVSPAVTGMFSPYEDFPGRQPSADLLSPAAGLPSCGPARGSALLHGQDLLWQKHGICTSWGQAGSTKIRWVSGFLSALPADAGGSITTRRRYLLFPCWGGDGLARFCSVLLETLGCVQGGEESQQVGTRSTGVCGAADPRQSGGGEGRAAFTEPASRAPCLHSSAGREEGARSSPTSYPFPVPSSRD